MHNKKGCVIAFGDLGGKKYLFKNRDRNYIPELKVYHTKRNGVEMVFFKDENTGWVEGINQYGIAVANSALLVLWDEKEGSKSADKATLGRVGSKDAERVLKALESKDLDIALENILYYLGGIRGHTIVSDGKAGHVIEHTAKHKAHVIPLDMKTVTVRSNHGVKYPSAGYTEGDNLKSSKTRLDKVEKAFSKAKSPDELIEELYSARGKNIEDPFNVVRRTDNMFTSSQLVYDFEAKKITLYLVPDDCDFLGSEKTFEGKGVCSFEVKQLGFFEEDGSFEVTNLRTASSHAQRVASRYLKRLSRRKLF
jgi:hypothetical protein